MKKLVAMVAVEIVALTCLGVWMTVTSEDRPGPNAFTAVGYALVASFN